jgi:hypothetical protein
MRTLHFVLCAICVSAACIAQDSNAIVRARYGFVKGQAYVYKSVSRNLDETRATNYVEDNYSQTKIVTICAQDVDSAGNADLLFTVNDERYEPIGSLDAASLSGQGMTRRGMADQKYRARLTPKGDYLSGEILEESAELQAIRASLKPGDALHRPDPAVLVKFYAEENFPPLPSNDRVIPTSPENSMRASGSVTWMDRDGNTFTSAMRDSIEEERCRYRILETTLLESSAKDFGYEECICRTVFRKSDGVVIEWKQLSRSSNARSVSQGEPVQRFWNEHVVLLEEEKPCAR